MKPTLKSPESKRSKVEHEKLLSNFAFKFNLRRYTLDNYRTTLPVKKGLSSSAAACVLTGRGLPSSNFWLNVSTFCGIRWVHDFPPVY